MTLPIIPLDNSGVPPETIIRHQAVEIGKLKAEVDELREQLERKERAISAFKNWQRRMVDYKLKYWVSVVGHEIGYTPDPRLVQILKDYDRHKDVAMKLLQRLSKMLWQHQEDMNIVHEEYMRIKNEGKGDIQG